MPQFRLRDLLAAILLIAVLLAVLVPLIQRAREESRRMSCASTLKNIGLAIHNYHSAYKQLPLAMGGSAGNGYRISGLVGLVPFIGDQTLWDQLSGVATGTGIRFPESVPSPTDVDYAPWRTQLRYYQCPTDGNVARDPNRDFGRTNYTFCIGDGVKGIHDPKSLNLVRGMSSPRVVTKFADVTDGLSNTIMAGEVANARGRRRRGQFVVDAPSAFVDRPIDCLQTLDPNSSTLYSEQWTLSELGRGGNWADGAAGHSLFQTVLPPNGPSCAINPTPADGLFSAGSYHVGGCHVLMGDGAVQFINDVIDTGDLAAAPPAAVATDDGIPIESPYGVWGALGTRNSTEGDVGFARSID